MMTTTSAGLPIVLSMSSKSKLVAAPASCSRTAKVKRVATIRLLLKFQVTLHLRGATRVFAEIATRSGAPVPRPARQPVLLVERKNHVNGRIDINRLAVEQSRLIAPLPDSIQRVLLKQWMAAHDFELLDRAILADDRVQTHGAGDAGLARQRRINRLDAIHDSCGYNIAADAERTGLVWPRWRRRSAHATDDAAEDAAHGTAGNATRNAPGHANGHVGFGLFPNLLDLLGDDPWLYQLASVHQMRLWLDVDDLGNRWRRRRWRRRRRRGEHGGHHRFGKRLGVNQRNENQNQKKEALERHRDQDCPRLVGLLRIRTGNHHFFKHGSYLLPAGAKRPGTFSLPRALLPAAGPVPTATPRPRQRFQANTSGAAIPKLEYVPTTIPTTRAKEKARSTWPPIRNRTSTVRKVKPLVKIVRERVWLMDLLTTSANDSLRSKRLFSRMRSKMTMVSFIE